MPDQNALRNCIRLCEHLSAMIEDDRTEMGSHLEGDAMQSYAELTKLEVGLLEDCKRLLDRGR